MLGIGPLELMIILLVGFFLIGSGVFVGAIVWGMSHNAASKPTGSPDEPEQDNAMDIARERYARGEINHEEFEQIKSTLGY